MSLTAESRTETPSRMRRVRAQLRRTRKGFPIGLIGMLAIVPSVELYVARHDHHFSSSGPWDWQRAVRRAEREAPGCDVLCFGDSLMKLGALPRVIEARTGRRAYNLALIGGQVPAATVLLRRAVEAGSRPTAVLISFMPPLLAADVDRNARQWPELLDLGECLELAGVEEDASLFARLALARAIPSVKARPDIRAAIRAAVRGESSSKGHEVPMHRRNWAFNRGAMLLPRYGDARDIPLWYAVNYPEPWTCNPTNAEYLRRFLCLAAEHDIAVHWLLPPIDPEAQALVEAGGQEARFERFVRRIAESFPNLTVIDGRHADFNRAAFTDVVHLHSGGAYALSNALSEILHPARAVPFDDTREAGRWVALPSFLTTPVDVPLEDINQSMLAVREAEARRR